MTTFRKVAPGLYGTGIHDAQYCAETHAYHSLRCECDTVEQMIDRYTDRDGWYIRWVCPCGHFSDVLGEWYPTLRDAKDHITLTNTNA